MTVKFEDYAYKRPEIEKVEVAFRADLEKFKLAKNVEEQSLAMKNINNITNELGTMFNLCYIRHTIDTEDEFYKNENDYMDEIMPHIEGLRSEYYQALTSSQFRDELEKNGGSSSLI